MDEEYLRWQRSLAAELLDCAQDLSSDLLQLIIAATLTINAYTQA
jgi:hypothetical protein